MTKISVDLHSDPNTIVSSEILSAVTLGCLETLKGLGALGEMIEVFRITFNAFPRDKEAPVLPGPVIQVHYRDPLGHKGSFGTDYRFMGSAGPDATAEQIKKHLLFHLKEDMRLHVQNGRGKLDEATRSFERLGQSI